MPQYITNPILPGFNPDPSIVRVDDDYYIATSTFEWYPGVQIHHSKDLKHWRLISRPLNRADLLDMRGVPDSCGVWAPCLSYCDGLFYLIYTSVKRFDGSFKDTPNYLTSCTTIDGEWKTPTYLNCSGFDPSLFHDDDGRKYLVNMVWDHRHKRHPFAGVYLQEYSEKQQKLVGPITNIFAGSALGLTEAPHLYKRNDYYYLLTAEGGTGYNHAMTLARSRNITGPYQTDPEGYLLTAKDNLDLPLQRCGHGDIVETQTGDHYIVHLCSRPLPGPKRSPMGRETALQPVQWLDNWCRIPGSKGNGLPKIEFEIPSVVKQPWPSDPSRDDFDSATLNNSFQWLRTPFPEAFMSLTERPGWLRLRGKESIGSWFEQALVARRQEHFNYTAETCLDFHPLNFQQMAGLVVYYNAHKFHYLYLSVDDQKQRFIDIMSCEGNSTLSVEYPLQQGSLDTSFTSPRYLLPQNKPVFLRAVVNMHNLQFWYSTDAKRWVKLPVNLDYSLISDEAGKGEGVNFTGAFVGVAAQDVSGQNIAADFDYFEYLGR